MSASSNSTTRENRYDASNTLFGELFLHLLILQCEEIVQIILQLHPRFDSDSNRLWDPNNSGPRHRPRQTNRGEKCMLQLLGKNGIDLRLLDGREHGSPQRHDETSTHVELQNAVDQDGFQRSLANAGKEERELETRLHTRTNEEYLPQILPRHSLVNQVRITKTSEYHKQPAV